AGRLRPFATHAGPVVGREVVVGIIPEAIDRIVLVRGIAADRVTLGLRRRGQAGPQPHSQGPGQHHRQPSSEHHPCPPPWGGSSPQNPSRSNYNRKNAAVRPVKDRGRSNPANKCEPVRPASLIPTRPPAWPARTAGHAGRRCISLLRLDLLAD